MSALASDSTARASDTASAAPAPQRGRLFVKYVVSLVGLVAVLLIGNGALDVWFSYRDTKQTLVRIQQEKAEAAAERIAAFIEEIQRQIGWTTHAQWSAGTVDQRRFDYVRLLRQVPAITELTQLDSAGHEQLKVSRLAMDVVGSGTDDSRDPKFTEAVAHKVWFGPVYFRKESEPYMTIAIAHAGRNPGVTVADVNLKLIWDVVSDIKVGKAGYAYVVGPDGRLIAHPDISLVLRNTDLSSLPQVKAALSDAGAARDPGAAVTIAPNYAGLSVLTAHAAIPALHWLVFVEQPASEALEPLYELLTRSGILLGLGLLLAAVAGGFLARRMVVPIRALQRGAERLGAGELDHRIELKTGDEIEALADRFNRMGAQLQDSYATLEAKVEARTHELAESLEQQTATAEVLKVISSSPGELRPVFDAMLENATRLCRAEFGRLTLFDGKVFTTAAVRGATPEYARFLEGDQNPLLAVTADSATALSRMAHELKPVHKPDLLADPAYVSRETFAVAAVELGGARSLVAVPLIRDQQLIGGMTLFRQRVEAFTDKEIALVATFADQAVIAIENARLITETREALERQTATAEVLRVINSSPGDLAPVFDTILQKAHSLCGVAQGSLQLYDGGKFRAVAVHALSEALADRLRQPFEPGPNLPSRRLLEGARFAQAADCAEIDDPMARAAFEHGGIRTVLFIPLRKDNTLLGQIVSARREVKPFAEKEIALLESFADQAVIAIENARLITETREALEQQTATAEVLQVINSSPGDLAPVFEAILQKAHSLCDVAMGSLQLCDGENFRAVAVHGLPAAQADRIRQGYRLGPNNPARPLLEGARFSQAPEVGEIDDPVARSAAELAGIRTILFIPLRKDDRLLGVISASRREVKLFTEKEIALLESFAAQAVIAIENARLINETREALEQQTATAEVLQVINSSPGNLTPVFDAMLEKATRVCSADAGVLATYDGEQYWPVAVRGFGECPRDPIRPHPETGIGRIARGEDVVHILDSAEGEALRAGDPGRRAIVELGGARSQLTAALRKEGKLLGSFTIWRRQVRAFSDKEIALAQNFAAQAVIAMENARLITETREALERQTATAEVLQVINSSPGNLAPVFDAMLEKAMRLCDAVFGGLGTWEGNRFGFVAARGPQPLAEYIASNEVSLGSREGFSRVARGEGFVQFADISTSALYESGDRYTRFLVDVCHARTTLSVPLAKDDTASGVLAFFRQEVRPFSEKEIALVRNFAAQAVIAMENARLITETREALEQQTATAEVLQVINSSPGDLAPVFEAMLEKATRLCDAAFGILLTYDGERFRHAAMQSVPAPYAEFMRQNPPSYATETGPGRILAGERLVHVVDAMDTDLYRLGDRNRRALVDLAGARSLLLVPLLKGDVVRGIIAIYRREVRPFSDKQIALVQNFAAQSVIAMENARLISETREALEQQTATAEVLQVINASPGNLAPVFEAMLEKATRVCSADAGVLATYDGEQYWPVAVRGFDEFPRGAIRPHPEMGIGRVVRGEDIVHIVDSAAGEVYESGHPARRAIVELGGARSTLSAALRKEGRLLGSITIWRREVRPFSDKEIALAQNFAAQAVIAMENARLLTETREALERQTATAEVLQVINSSPGDLAPVFDAMLEKATGLCEAKFGFLALYEDGAYTYGAGRNLPTALDEALRQGPHRPGPHTALLRMSETGTPVHIEDVRNDIAYTEQDPWRVAAVEQGGARAQLVVPLLKKGELIGAFVIYRQEPRRFADSQIALVTTFAAQAVIAIENARLLSELRDRSAELARSVDELTATSDVLKIISRSSVELQTVLDTLVETAARLCHADQSYMFRRRGDRYHVVSSLGITEEFSRFLEENPLTVGRGSAAARAASEGRTVHIPDVVADPEYTAQEQQRRAQYRTALAVPLMRENVLIGIFSLTRTRVNPFTGKEIELLGTFADQAVIAIENARLFEELRDRSAELARSVDELTATSDVLKIISRSSVELQTVLDTLVETAARLCHADKAFMFRRRGDRYYAAALIGASEEFKEYVERNPFAAGRGTTTGRAVAERRTIHIADVLADPEYSYPEEGQRLGGLRTILAVPLMRENALIGVFTLVRTHVDPFTDKEIDLVTTFADQAMIAIENARLFEELRDRSAELARSVDELTTLREVGQAVSSTLDLATVLETIVMRAVALARADAGAIFRYRKSDRQFRLGTVSGLDAELVVKIRGTSIPEEETAALKRAIAERAPVQIPDLDASPHLPLRDLMAASGFRAVLIVPLLAANRVFGVLSIQKKTVGEFPEGTIKLMQTFASQSALAIQNARLFREVEEQGHALAEASRHKSQFLANMSHELRTPLNAVLGYAELLADGIYGELGEKARGVLERIQSNGKHLLGLINDVLDLSKIEAGQLTLAIGDYAMPAVVHSVASATESLAKAKGLALVTSVPRVLPMGRGDERRLTQVLLNLVGNAIKFTETGSVGIEVAVADNRFELAVKDTGPGIAKADQARIFEEFQQVDSSSTRQKGGTGLGLAISKRIVEMHGGTLTVDSEPGKGSTFLVIVPVQAELAKEVA